jgi:plastocyanin domain-containing protein
MLRIVVISLALVAGCKRAEDTATKPPPAPAKTAPAVAPDGPRRIEITANADGYTPSEVAGKPGEKLTLVFTRTIEAECISKLKTPGGDLVDLPLNKPVDVAVTVPQTGKLGFGCGMDMFHGAIVATP